MKRALKPLFNKKTSPHNLTQSRQLHRWRLLHSTKECKQSVKTCFSPALGKQSVKTYFSPALGGNDSLGWLKEF